jgi:hypothetical protein
MASFLVGVSYYTLPKNGESGVPFVEYAVPQAGVKALYYLT